MKKIAHISDLHFGRVNYNAAEGLLADIKQHSPDLVIISGDLTQRARISQFKEAREYIKKLGFPVFVIPGNHDIPFFDIVRRFFGPLDRYKEFITEDLRPFYMDEEIAVYGINTARSNTWSEGRISIEQIAAMKEKLCALPNDLLKIVVTHHPFIVPPGRVGIRIVGRAVRALDIMDECQIDLLLAGHLHDAFHTDIRTYHTTRKRSVIVAQAGTSISKRTRYMKPNSYNLIQAANNYLRIEERRWNDSIFETSLVSILTREGDEWEKAEEVEVS
jgi:3',5'-cyclic AMP phosphodiesterase CpdA